MKTVPYVHMTDADKLMSLDGLKALVSIKNCLIRQSLAIGRLSSAKPSGQSTTFDTMAGLLCIQTLLVVSVRRWRMENTLSESQQKPFQTV